MVQEDTEKSANVRHCKRGGVTLSTMVVIATLAVGAPSLADSSLPTQQSDCEIRANQFKAKHPHIDSFELLKSGFFDFEETFPHGSPQAYHDAESGVVFYVETDGRHVAAIAANGTVLWIRDPFVERNMCPYRSAHPFIAWIGAPGGNFGRDYLDTFKPTPDPTANARIVKELDREIALGRKIQRPKNADRFIGLAFNSSQFGYMNIRNGDFYEMGQD